MGHALEVEKFVKKGYKQAAFSNKRNADYFKALWKEKGYDVEVIISSGPTLESPNKRVTNAYYVIATAHKAVYGTDDVAKRVINKFL